MGACRVCRPAEAGDPSERESHGSRRELLPVGAPHLWDLGVEARITRFIVPEIRASAVTMLLDDGEGLAQRRRGAEGMGFSIIGSKSPSGERFQGCLHPHLPLLLSGSAALREMSAAGEWLWNGDEDAATPFSAGAVSRCATVRVSAGFHLDGSGGAP